MGEADTSRAVKKMTDLDSCVESYDLKISVQNKGKVDIRLKFIHGKPLIIAVRKDEEKILISDILCLHRYECMIEQGQLLCLPLSCLRKLIIYTYLVHD